MKAAFRESSPPPTFRDFLRDQLAQRCASNPQYSLRAFANYLGVHHSTLSQMLRGKRTLTAEAIEKFAIRLGLSSSETESWIAAERNAPPLTTERWQRLNELARDTAEVLEDWRNFAILELTRLRDFQPDSRWIARMLAIEVDDVNIAVSRLCRLRLLEMTDSGTWRDLMGDVVMDVDHFQQAALDRFLEQTADGPRDVTTATVAIPAAAIPEAIDRIAAFRSSLLAWLESIPGKDEVYQLEIRFVPVTRRSLSS